MDKSVFLKSNDAVLYLVSGKKDALNLPILDSTTSEGAGEKHLPVVECSGKNITVKVGSVAHPMSEEHSIDWIFLETKKGGQLVKLSPQDAPVADLYCQSRMRHVRHMHTVIAWILENGNLLNLCYCSDRT